MRMVRELFTHGADNFRLLNVENDKCVDTVSDNTLLPEDVRIPVIKKAQAGKQCNVSF